MKEQTMQSVATATLRVIATSVGISLALAVAVSFAWHWLDKKHHPRIAVVDIAAIMKVKEAQFTEMLSKPGVTDDDRRKSYDQIQRFGADLGAAVKELPQKCGCIVVNKAAIVVGEAEDLTADLKTSLGMQ